MNKRQFEVQKMLLEQEEELLDMLKKMYTKASEDCAAKISSLAARTDVENLKSVIWQKQYQQALKKQIDGILNRLDSESFDTMAGYLAGCYEEGFLGTLYDLQGQGIPLIFPVNQEEAVMAVRVDSRISKGLYQRMGEEVKGLKDSIRSELSRGVAGGDSWGTVAGRIAFGMRSPFLKAYNRAAGIARTEGHRIQQEAALHCQQKAKSRGADVVKQWDSTMDSLTRPHHRELDGQIREVEEPFEVVGKKAMYPGGFGDPSEDCNCRCCLVQTARWELVEGEDYTKWDGDKNELVRVKAKTYNEFKDRVKEITGGAGIDTTRGDQFISSIKEFMSQNPGVSIKELGRKILDDLNLNNIADHLKVMKEHGYCQLDYHTGVVQMLDYNLNSKDSRSYQYRVKTAFHEAFHAKSDGLKIDIAKLGNEAWKDIEEIFAESSAHYLAGQMGITDLAPAYSSKLCEMLPRLKQLPEFSFCSTIADFGKIAFNGRMNGQAPEWTDFYNRAMGVPHDWKTYSKQYFPTITANADDYIDKMLENMPDHKRAREQMKGELGTAIEKINTGNANMLTRNENIVIKNVLAIAMNRMGVK